MNVAISTSEQIPAFSPNPGFHGEKSQGETTQKETPVAPLMWAHSPLLVDRSSLSGHPLHGKPSHYKGSKRSQQAGYSKASERHYRLRMPSDASALCW